MTDMFFADNGFSTKAVQKCQAFCPISIIGIILLFFSYRNFNIHTYGDLDTHDIHE